MNEDPKISPPAELHDELLTEVQLVEDGRRDISELETDLPSLPDRVIARIAIDIAKDAERFSEHVGQDAAVRFCQKLQETEKARDSNALGAAIHEEVFRRMSSGDIRMEEGSEKALERLNALMTIGRPEGAGMGARDFVAPHLDVDVAKAGATAHEALRAEGASLVPRNRHERRKASAQARRNLRKRVRR